MYICVCQGVTENQIRDAAAKGADTMESLSNELGVCMNCGTCACAVDELLEELRETGQVPPRVRLSIVRSA